MSTASFLASFYLACGVIIFFLAITILRHSAKNVVNWSTALVLLFAGTGPILGAISTLLERTLAEGTVLFQNLVSSFDYIWEFFFPALVLFALVHPRRNKLWKYIKRYSILLFLPHIFHLVMLIFLIERVDPEQIFTPLTSLSDSPGFMTDFLSTLTRILNILMGLLFKVHQRLFSLVNIGYAAFSLVLLGYSLRKDLSPRERRQMQFVIAGLGLCIFTYSLTWVVPLFSGMNFPQHVSTALINAALIIGGGTIAYTIVRHQFLGMRLIARRAIFYAIAVTIFASVYLLTVKQITRFFAQYSGANIDVLETGMTILFIILFLPFLSRLEEWIERVLVREEGKPRVRITVLSDELLSMVDIDAMRDRIKVVLTDVFDTREAELVLAEEILSSREFDIYADQVCKVLSQINEPIVRLDFLEAMGFTTLKGRAFMRPGKKFVNEAIEMLPETVKRFARYELIVPVIHEGECTAVILLGTRSGRGKYSADEQAMLSMLSSQVSAALTRIDLLEEVVEKKVMEEELTLARTIQLNLLPSAPPVLDNYEVSAMSLASKQVGGDYYDFIHHNGYLALAVADVSGKGVPASLLMASLQASLRSSMDHMNDPVGLVGRMNNVMCDTTATDKFATLFYACLDLKHHELNYTNAGHFFPVVVRDGGAVEILDYSGLILGVMPEYGYEHRRLKLQPGDSLVITTDGVTEAEGATGDLYGEERLHQLLSSMRNSTADDIKEAIIENVNVFAQHEGVNDDLTILVLKRTQ
jgi:sigma-B regulation protein RsbU (phosphoserine phosphatase)